MVDRERTRSGAGDDASGRQLVGWKAIGLFLGCTERTARRWEADRALPVHRIPGGGRSSIWASPDELASWLRALPSDVQATMRSEANSAAANAATEPPPYLSQWLVAALVVAVLAIAGVVLWNYSVRASAGTRQRLHGPYDDNPEARETYMTARFELASRSAESLAAAEQGFRQLVERYPERAAGWSGLADTYLLEREFGSMPDEVAYPQAARAARTALALDPRLADAWLDQAFVAWWWQGDSATAFRDFTTALELNPDSAKAQHWYATALSAHGENERSLQAIARARALDPASRAIVADEAWIRFGSGQQAAGLATLEHLAQLDPGFVSWHSYLARAYLILGRDGGFLREAQAAAELRGQKDALARLHAVEEQFRSGGRGAMLNQLSANEADGLAEGAGSAVIVAGYRALANDREGMLKWLAVAEAGHDHNLPSLRGYPEFSAYRDDEAFQHILTRLP